MAEVFQASVFFPVSHNFYCGFFSCKRCLLNSIAENIRKTLYFAPTDKTDNCMLWFTPITGGSILCAKRMFHIRCNLFYSSLLLKKKKIFPLTKCNNASINFNQACLNRLIFNFKKFICPNNFGNYFGISIQVL